MWLHPVAWLGAAIDRLERQQPKRERQRTLGYGAVATLGLTSGCAAIALTAEAALQGRSRFVRIITFACLLKPAFAVRGLLYAASDVRRALDAGDLPQAREALRSLVSRDTSSLSAEECAAAAVESLAENVTDSFAAAWLAWLLFGLPGAWMFRSMNTLDSRWGYRGSYEWLGRTAAVSDDILAAVPARLSAILLIAAAGLTRSDLAGAVRSLMRDRRQTASPNAGWTMATMAGALGRRLEKTGAYVLNAAGGPCDAGDIARAQRIVGVSAALLLFGATALALGVGSQFGGDSNGYD
jgi:adenosylcobinamide-phosphate synthase